MQPVRHAVPVQFDLCFEESLLLSSRPHNPRAYCWLAEVPPPDLKHSANRKCLVPSRCPSGLRTRTAKPTGLNRQRSFRSLCNDRLSWYFSSRVTGMARFCQTDQNNTVVFLTKMKKPGTRPGCIHQGFRTDAILAPRSPCRTARWSRHKSTARFQ